MIDAAARPILYLGGGVVHAEAAEAARAVAERSALPTVMTLMGLGTLPTYHDCRSACSVCTRRRTRTLRSTSAISWSRSARASTIARRASSPSSVRALPLFTSTSTRQSSTSCAPRSSRFAPTRATCSNGYCRGSSSAGAANGTSASQHSSAVIRCTCRSSTRCTARTASCAPWPRRCPKTQS